MESTIATWSIFLFLIFICELSYHSVNSKVVWRTNTDLYLHAAGGTRLFKSSKKMKFRDAFSYCQSQYGRLAVIQNGNKNAEVGRKGYDVWIGFNDRAREGVFRWVSGIAMREYGYRHWRSPNPDNYYNEDCGQYGSKRKKTYWNDLNCAIPLNAMCEVRKNFPRRIVGVIVKHNERKTVKEWNKISKPRPYGGVWFYEHKKPDMIEWLGTVYIRNSASDKLINVNEAWVILTKKGSWLHSACRSQNQALRRFPLPDDIVYDLGVFPVVKSSELFVIDMRRYLADIPNVKPLLKTVMIILTSIAPYKIVECSDVVDLSGKSFMQKYLEAMRYASGSQFT